MDNFNKEDFKPDLEHETQFPWEDVIPRLKYRLKGEEFCKYRPCPKCNRASENLIWITFRSPAITWKNLCGCEGPLSICPQCNIQVEFITRIIN